ncbi:hypothetical protein EVJ58_g5935 [Rhodofomes roseus]|uniref:Uncharacterized protein n=1 Tax=Rhodofomes roseus TaxID=34475 RepID=A0A4Y9Y9D9_9APHY|nr:hypothetical protein EVJ58_g5935 [Rhodofomes roseus]
MFSGTKGRSSPGSTWSTPLPGLPGLMVPAGSWFVRPVALLIPPDPSALPQRMLFESYALATAHGDARIPLPSGIPEVCELIEHLDRVFLNLRSEQNEAPLLYATIPWSPDQLQREQAAAEEARPPPPPSYNDPPLRLSSLRGSTDNWDRVLAATDRSLEVLRLELGHLHRGLAEARIDQLSVMREVVSISGRLEDICDARDIPPPLELIRD